MAMLEDEGESGKITVEEKIEGFSDSYVDFIENCKTETEVVAYLREKLRAFRYKSVDEFTTLPYGSFFFQELGNRAMIAGSIGKDVFNDGFRILASHIDSPRVDLKPKPLYEDSDTGIALMKTQYYGGIKKYQWVNVPLAMHGQVVLKSGEVISIRLGDKRSEPVFVIPDLLPHLAKKQFKRELVDGIEGEEMNLIVGISAGNAEKDPVKSNVLALLKQKYGIEEEDLASADLSLVPAFGPRYSGFDNSMIAGYGHDDRASAFTTFRALLENSGARYSSLAIFYDKEEIGGYGISGSMSNMIESVVHSILRKVGPDYSMADFYRVLRNSRAISADVDSAMDPSFKDVHDDHNAARMGKGIVIAKYTGYGGKYSGSEAPSEYVAHIRKVLSDKGVKYQFGTMGKVDEGGGGTVAQDIARYGIPVIDAGPPVLGMHSPFELVSKKDLYESYLAYLAFLTEV